jgi:hypothetical protein
MDDMSTYTKANDRMIKAEVEILPGQDYTWIIEKIQMETLTNMKGEEDRKPVVYFRGQKKCFPLNKTNAKSFMSAIGSDAFPDYVGRKVTLYAKWERNFGEEAYCIRVRSKDYKPEAQAADSEVPVDPNAAAPDDPGAEFSDDIQF